MLRKFEMEIDQSTSEVIVNAKNDTVDYDDSNLIYR